MKILVIDTETASGFKPKGAEWWSTPQLLPKLAQVSWITTTIQYIDDIYKEIGVGNEYDTIIYPEDITGAYYIQNEEIHGINTTIAKENGTNITNVIKDLIIVAGGYDLIIGHNLYFDMENLLAAGQLNKISIGNQGELYKVLNKEKRFDTMQCSTKICKLPKSKGVGYKWPKLEELHAFLFDGETFNAHNSLEDCKATLRCFIELVNKYPVESGLDKYFPPIRPIDEDNVPF